KVLGEVIRATDYDAADPAAWLNPPYNTTDIKAFMTKCKRFAATGNTVTALIPAVICTKWFLDNVSEVADIYPMFPRISFIGMDQGIDRDLCIAHYSPTSTGALKPPIYWKKELEK
nr:hypothetical protein [Nitrosospira sp.]